MRVFVLVPTCARPDDLLRCLGALDAQTRRPDGVVVVARPEDRATTDVLASARFDTLAPTLVTVAVPGQVAALNAGLAQVRRCGADVVAITDDDAAPRPDWCARIAAHFEGDGMIAGVGGRDWLHAPNGEVDDAEMAVVGKVQWFGRIIGGHQRGVGAARSVDVLKGVNMSFRLTAIDGLTFDEDLRGAGAQIFNDYAFSLAVRARGGRLVFDPLVAVDHYPGERTEGQPRVGRSADAVAEAAYNETRALMVRLRGLRAIAFIVWSVLVGSRLAPGVLVAVRLRLQGRRDAWSVLRAAISARRAALRSGPESMDR
ncbi:MAG: glycosyltransferase family 2 protein [Microthrixaceae bacterium]